MKQTLVMGLVFVLSACSTMAPKAEDSTRLKSLALEVRDEVLIGREISAKLLGRFGVYENAKALEYVNLVGHNLAARSGRPEIQFCFSILDTPDVNAFAAPGGYVFITRGLLSRLNDEAELAAVLSHEIAHINEKHMYRQIAPKHEVSANETVVRLLAHGRMEINAAITQAAREGIKILLEVGPSPKWEMEADEAGILYATEAGYDAPALSRLLSRLQKTPNGDIETSGKGYLPFPERTRELDSFLKENDMPEKGSADANVLGGRFQQALASLQGKGGK